MQAFDPGIFRPSLGRLMPSTNATRRPWTRTQRRRSNRCKVFCHSRVKAATSRAGE